MRSKARIGDHPIHPMIVVMPLGLWIFSFIADILYLLGYGDTWRLVSAYCMAGGIIGALVAAVPGFIDFLMITGTHAKKKAVWHMVLNLVAVAVYSVNFFLRYQHNYEAEGAPFTLSLLSVVIISISGWLGGELAYVHHVGVIEENERRPPRNRIRMRVGPP